SVEKALAQPAGLRPLSLEAMKIQKSMQTNKLEPAVERVRNAVFGEENRLPSLFDHPPIGEIGSITRSKASGGRNQCGLSATTGDVDNQRFAVKTCSVRNGRGPD